MIDPTKPIRRKGGLLPRITEFVTCVYQFEGEKALFWTLAQLDRDFENVPEPRKRREFWINVYAPDEYGARWLSKEQADLMVEKRHGHRRTACLRFVESPEGEVLPDLPDLPDLPEET